MKQLSRSIQQDPTDAFAALVAMIAHPIFIGTLGLLTVVLNTVHNFHDQAFYLLLLMLLTFAPAALYLFVYFKGNIVEMLELINREARLVPYLLMTLGAVLAVLVLVNIHAPHAIFLMTLVLLANEIVLGTINFWTKVSIHTATATFTSIMLGYLIDPVWYGLLALVPLIAWARVYRKRHTLQQVISGVVFASVITVLVITLGQHFL